LSRQSIVFSTELGECVFGLSPGLTALAGVMTASI
jgi:hypothetical protein